MNRQQRWTACDRKMEDLTPHELFSSSGGGVLESRSKNKIE